MKSRAALDCRSVAERAMLGLGRTGSPSTNGSGDYVIAFSAARQNRVRGGEAVRQVQVLGNEAMSPLFLATVEATEEAIDNSLFKATTVTRMARHRVEALPLEPTIRILRRYGVTGPGK